ncbi:MAG TPA: ABC transporter ATP-binding protein [Candidatus Acidoferrales bacterium]|nr:ABC transporter ATP-binding protein [Candidatus Acidoferrales bacterium]
MSSAPLAGARVQLEHVCVRYEGADRNAVDDVTLDVPPGQFVVFLGPSGSGKSTLLRTINRLAPITSGTIFLGERNVLDEDLVRLRRGIGYVIQAVGLFPHLTVAQNIAVVPQLLGWERMRTQRRVDELLEMIRLEPARYRDRLPRQLSGGEAQRVGVARALAAQPPVLLMDEPFGAVDPIVRLALGDELLEIHRALRTTIFFVTHDVDEALRIADRIVVLRNGNIEQDDTPLRTLAHPATPYVANLVDARNTVRRLVLLGVRDAMRPTAADAPPAPARIAADRSLQEALSALLSGGDDLDVYDGEARVGRLDFQDIRRALAASAA